jgi:uncharacterized surface protein with fasciclin (FAS1) repeats
LTTLAIASAADHAGYCTFAAALRATSHMQILEGDGPFTVFAPNDAAFRSISTAPLDRLLDGDPELLLLVLGYHFAPGMVSAARFQGKRIRAVMHAGGDTIIDGRTGLRVNAAHVIEPDIAASNGIIHGLDAVLWPREASLAAAS